MRIATALAITVLLATACSTADDVPRVQPTATGAATPSQSDGPSTEPSEPDERDLREADYPWEIHVDAIGGCAMGDSCSSFVATGPWEGAVAQWRYEMGGGFEGEPTETSGTMTGEQAARLFELVDRTIDSGRPSDVCESAADGADASLQIDELYKPGDDGPAIALYSSNVKRVNTCGTAVDAESLRQVWELISEITGQS